MLHLYLLQEVFLDYSCWFTPWSAPSTVVYAHVFFLAVLPTLPHILYGSFNHLLLGEDLGIVTVEGLSGWLVVF